MPERYPARTGGGGLLLGYAAVAALVAVALPLRRDLT